MMEEEHYLMKTETHRFETCHKLGNNSPHTWQTDAGVAACVRVQQWGEESHRDGGHRDDQRPLHSAGDLERTQPDKQNALK